MDAIKFIQNDVERAHQTSPWVRASLLVVALFFPILFGLGLRADFHGAFALRILMPNLMSAMLMIFAFKSIYEVNFHERVAIKIATILLVLSVVMAAEKVMFPAAARTVYANNEIFWKENRACFSVGALSTLILALYFGILSYLTASWPSRSYRALIAGTSGVSGMVMLGFHCDSSSLPHVFLSHFGQGFVVGLVFFVAQVFFYAHQLKRKFPTLIKKLKNPGDLSS